MQKSNSLILSIVFLFVLSSCNQSSKSPNTEKATNPETRTETPPTPATPCPWNLDTTKTKADYQSIGVEIKVDCEGIRPISTMSYQYTQNDLQKTLQVLDASFSVVKSSSYKPSLITVGEKSFHDSKVDQIQIVLGETPFSKQVPHYIDATLQLMEFEKREFASEVRFSFYDVQIGKDKNGNRRTIGSATMFAPVQATIEKDFAALKKFKQNILALKTFFPDVILFHGNELSRFDVNNWAGFYYFSSEVTDEKNHQFFHYLDVLGNLNKSYAPKTIDVQLYKNRSEGLKVDFEKTEKLLTVGLALKDVLSSTPMEELILIARRSNDSLGDDALNVDYYNGRLVISNIFTWIGNMLDIKLIKDCVASQDFSKPFSVKCPGHR